MSDGKVEVHCMCLDCVCMFCISRLPPQKIVLRHQIMRVSRPQKTNDCSVHKNVTLSCSWIIGCIGCCTMLLEVRIFPSFKLNIRKRLQRFVDSHHNVHEGLGVFPVPWTQDEVGPSISSLVVLCSFVRLVYMAVLVLVVCLCPSSARVVATFRVLFYFLYSVQRSCFFPNTLILFFI